MRDQYVGDVSDVLKFSLLRALAGNDRRLGVAWYYVPGHDRGPNGKHLSWRVEPAWRQLDSVLHSELIGLPERSIGALERAAMWPQGTLFHHEPMPPSWLQRDTWGAAKRTALQGADLVFLDPDTGVSFDETSTAHATFDELSQLRKPRRTLAFIKFPERSKHEMQVCELHENLQIKAGATRSITLRIHVSVPSRTGKTPTFRWFTVVDPDAELVAKTYAFAAALESVPDVGVKIHDS